MILCIFYSFYPFFSNIEKTMEGFRIVVKKPLLSLFQDMLSENTSFL